MNRKGIILFVMAASLLLASAALAAGSYSIPSWILSGGGGSATVGNTTLDYTVGQWIAGAQVSGDIELGSGFWFGREPYSPTTYKVFLPVVLKNIP